MLRAASWPFLGAVAMAVGVVGCPDDPPPVEDGALVIGLTSDDFGALTSSTHVIVRKAGSLVSDESLQPSGSASASSLLPKEIPVTGRAGARIDVTAEAQGIGGGPPIVVRAASAPLALGGKKLLRVHLDSRCVVLGNAPPTGVSCAAPLTCIAGSCASPDVDLASLEDYEPGWASAPPDICRPAKHGPPEVVIGTGQTAYLPLAEGQGLELEKGPQGGHHIWIATRMRNLRQSGSTTAITSRIVDDPMPVPPMAFVFTFERDEGAYCAIWGLRYQVDANAPDLREGYKRFLGKRLEVTVEVRDSTGASARDTRTVQLADKLLCPDGTTACN
jgi:hypothetical protein